MARKRVQTSYAARDAPRDEARTSLAQALGYPLNLQLVDSQPRRVSFGVFFGSHDEERPVEVPDRKVPA
jgi:hypothetical protein